MCTGAELLVPLLTTAAGTAIQASNQNRALQRQSEEAARGQRAQMALRDKAAQRVNQQIQDVAKSDPRAEEAQAESDFITALQRAKVARGGADLEGRGGARFQDDLGIARTQAEAEGKTLANQLARIDAPQFQRFREGVNANNTATDISLLGDSARARDFLTRMRASQHQPDPLMSGLGQGLTAYGMARAGRASTPRTTLTPVTNADFDYMTPYDNGDVFRALARNGG